MFDPDRDSVARALRLFSAGILGERHSLKTTFECLGNDLQLRAMLIEQQHAQSQSPECSHERQLARPFTYASFRLTELVLRLEHLNWMQQEFANRTGDDAAQWGNFAALAIKDFHLDLGSLMDAAAPAILQTTGSFDAQREHKLPGFADIQRNGSPRSHNFRASMAAEILRIIDSTDRLWPAVKRMRDDLAHREHTKIVFRSATQGILFQVYTPAFAPIVLNKALAWNGGHNVADFRVYSAAALGEMLVFLDDIGRALAAHLKIVVESLTPSMRAGDFTYLIEPLERLLKRLGAAQ
jgi:hypothetical protein